MNARNTRNRLALVTLAALAGSASGQSFYIDFGNSIAPSSAFGGAAETAGFWNRIQSSTTTSVALRNTANAATAVTLTRPTGTSMSSVSNFNVTGDTAELMEDFETIASGPLDYTIGGLAAGNYLIITYVGHANNSGDLYGTVVGGASGLSTQTSGDYDMPSNSWKMGGTHSLHYRALPSGGSISVTVGGVFGITAACAGMQIIHLPDSSRVRFYVNDNGAGFRSGFSWNNTFVDLNDALSAATRIGGAKAEIWTAQGIYRPTTGTNRSATFTVPSDVRLYGGFAGTETSLSQRTSPAFFITSLSGAIGTSADTDNSLTVVDASGTSAGTLIDGFSVIRGYNSGGGGTGRGGGMDLSGSFATVRNTKFISNSASVMGGGVYAETGTPKFVNCLFFNNDSGGDGAGAGFKNNFSRPEFWNTQFIGNVATGGGGAIATTDAAIVTANCLFSGNVATANRGGAILLDGVVAGNKVSWITNTSMSGNTASLSGGAIHAKDASSVAVWNSVIWGNNSAAAVLLDKETSVNTAGGDTSAYSFSSSTVRGRSGANGLDPLFADPDGNDNTIGTSDDNLRLRAGSPAIDTGEEVLLLSDSFDLDADNNVIEPMPLDFAGNARRSDVLGAADGPLAGSPALDRGAYELQMPGCVADVNQDGEIDLVDFFQFLNDFDASNPGADVDLSGDVDLNDFFAFLNAFDTSCT